MTLDIIVILAGYIDFFQANWVLDSPLIPNSLVYQVMASSGFIMMKASVLSTAIFLVGLWFYSFNQKRAAIGLFSLCVLCFLVTIRL